MAKIKKLILLILCLCSVAVFAQNRLNTLRAEYIHLAAINTQWEDIEVKKTIRVCILSKNTDVFNAYIKYSQDKKIKNKHIEVQHSRLESQIRIADVLYIDPNYDWQYSKILDAFASFPMLIITEKLPFDQTTVGFIETGNTLRIEVNLENANRHGLKMTKDFQNFAMTTVDDWRFVCIYLDQTIKENRDSMAVIKKNLSEFSEKEVGYVKDIQQLMRDIEHLRDSVSNQSLVNVIQRNRLNELNEQIADRRQKVDNLMRILSARSQDIDAQKIFINEQNTQILEQTKKLSAQQLLFAEQQEKIQQQKATLETKEAQISRQKMSLILTTILILIIGVVAFFMYANFQIKKKANKQLAEKNIAINKQKEEIEQAKREAEMANEAKSLFLANMSHEIRTPLNSVLGFANLLSDMVTDTKQKVYLSSITSGGKSLLTLINDILDLSKIEAGRMDLSVEPVNLVSIVHDLEKIFALKLKEKNTQLSIVFSQDFPTLLMLDEIRIRQILLNLIGNAVKFTDKGEIRVNAQIKNEYYVNNQKTLNIEIDVEDTGIGIAPEAIDVIFEAFRQQDGQNTKKFGGTGLGLAITKRLVEMMSGEISAQSTVGKGSCFTIKLIGVQEAKDKYIEAIQPTNYHAEQLKPTTILVADDVEHNRQLIKAYLTTNNKNITIIEAQNGAEAIEKTIQEKPDLILMDILMPILNGIEAKNEIRLLPEHANTPIIAITASAMKHDTDHIEKNKFDGLLLKPFTKQELINKIYPFLQAKETTDPNKAHEKKIVAASPELLAKLQKELPELWHEIKRGNRIRDNLEFGKKIKNIAQCYNNETLAEYSKKLLMATECFDVEEITRQINIFPEIVSAIGGERHFFP